MADMNTLYVLKNLGKDDIRIPLVCQTLSFTWTLKFEEIPCQGSESIEIHLTFHSSSFYNYIAALHPGDNAHLTDELL
jgi:hypothetical protein